MEPQSSETTTDLAAARAALSGLAGVYIRRYGTPVFDVRLEMEAGSPALVGMVLLPSQKDEALAAAAGAGLDVVDRLTVLADSQAPGPWFGATGALDVRAMPAGDLATQVQPGDPPVRRLLERGAWWLVDLADGTLGWIAADLKVEPVSDGPASVRAWRSDWTGSWRPARAAEWREAVGPWLGTPYVWGGTTGAGVDCSGFVQRLVRQVAGLGLPKNSRDQAAAGTRIARLDAAAGDLVYLTHKSSRVRHIAVVLDRAPTTVAHASLERGVVEEALDEVLLRYDFRQAVRLGAPPPAPQP